MRIKKFEIERHINSPDSKSYTGTCATFIPIDEEWGVKLFDDKIDRDYSLEQHVRYYDMGLAPLYGPKVNVVYYGEKRYGYLCELVECCDNAVLAHYGKEHNGVCKGSEYFDYCCYSNYSDFLQADKKWGNAELDLREKMEDNGVRNADLHAGNWGIRKNGEAVMIDFDKGYIDEGCDY